MTVNTGSGDGALGLVLADASGLAPVVINAPFTGTQPYSIDKTAPSLPALTIASSNADATQAREGDVVTVHITADEAIQAPAVTIAGHAATVSPVGSSATQYTASYTLTAGDAEGLVPFTILYQDLIGNAGTAAAQVTDKSTVTFDRTAPVPTAATTAANVTNAPFTVTFTFSEAVGNFQMSDLVLTNATATDFSATSSMVYTVLITPLAQGEVSVAVAAEIAEDAAGNGNDALTELKRIYDTVAPAGYQLAFDQAMIDFNNQGAVSLNVTGAESGTIYFYSISSAAGGTPVTGTAAAPGAAFGISNINVSGLNDGALTVTFYQQDAATNKGPEATAQVMKYTRNLVSFTRPATLLVPIRTTFAQAGLPATIEVTYSDNTRQSIPVTWAPGSYNGLVAGSYELSGTLTLAAGTTNLDQVQASMTVEVQPNKVPTALALSKTSFNPNIAGMDAATAEAIGAFTTTDADDNQHTYTLVNGTGSTDNGLFEIVGSALFLKTNKGLSGQTSFAIRVRSTDPYHNAIEQSLTLSKEAYAKPVAELKIVNTFSPNGDGNNDTWVIPELRFYNDVQVEIYDREGRLLFRSTDPEMGWDGKATNGLPLKGAVLYVVQIKDINLVKKGVVTILRK